MGVRERASPRIPGDQPSGRGRGGNPTDATSHHHHHNHHTGVDMWGPTQVVVVVVVVVLVLVVVVVPSEGQWGSFWTLRTRGRGDVFEQWAVETIKTTGSP